MPQQNSQTGYAQGPAAPGQSAPSAPPPPYGSAPTAPYSAPPVSYGAPPAPYGAPAQSSSGPPGIGFDHVAMPMPGAFTTSLSNIP